MTFMADARFNEDLCGTDDEAGRAHRQRNYELCDALDMIKLSVALDDMVEDGLHPQLAKIYKMQGAALLAALRSENNRTFNK